jgi:hypothetical protein
MSLSLSLREALPIRLNWVDFNLSFSLQTGTICVPSVICSINLFIALQYAIDDALIGDWKKIWDRNTGLLYTGMYSCAVKEVW